MRSTLGYLTSFYYLFDKCFASGESSLVATALFDPDNNGLDGRVMVVDGDLLVKLDINGLDLTNVPDTCFDGGLGFHIHELWEYNDLNDRTGSECGRSFTGNHWDPWVACGPATDNNFCISDGGCVPGSSVLSNTNGYNCNQDTFKLNPYACEVGDWNGKYGKAMVDDNGMIELIASSPYEVSATDLIGLSVVFHCLDGSRVFCAPFDVNFAPGVRTIRPTQSGNQDLVAKFDKLGEYSEVILGSNGKVSVDLNLRNLDTSECENGELALRVYNSCKGQFYDPTQSCAPESDSEFCEDDGLLCGIGEYFCNFNEPFDRFSCAPGDITGKFGTFDANANDAMLYENDPLLIDLSLANGKSLVLQCADSYKVLACATLTTSDLVVTESPTEEPTEEPDNVLDTRT